MSQQQQQQPSRQRPLRRARAKPVTTIPGTRLPSHEQTQSSQANRQVEKTLVVELNKYVNVIRKELDAQPSLQWTQLRAQIIPRLRDSVFQTMRSAVSQSYEIGAEYVTSRVGLSAASFLTHSDIDNIKNLTIEFTNKFFGRVQLSLTNTIRNEFYKQQPADSTLNPNFITTSVAVSATSKAMAEGSRLKAKSILQTNKSDNVSLLQGATAKKTKKKKKTVELLPAIDPLSEEDLLITNVGVGFAGGISLATLAASQLQEAAVGLGNSRESML